MYLNAFVFGCVSFLLQKLRQLTQHDYISVITLTNSVEPEFFMKS